MWEEGVKLCLGSFGFAATSGCSFLPQSSSPVDPPFPSLHVQSGSADISPQGPPLRENLCFRGGCWTRLPSQRCPHWVVCGLRIAFPVAELPLQSPWRWISSWGRPGRVCRLLTSHTAICEPPQPGLWPYSSALSLTFVSAASEGKQYLWMGMAGSLELTCLSVGTFHTVPYFSFVKFYLFSAVPGLAAQAFLWLWWVGATLWLQHAGSIAVASLAGEHGL